MSASKNNLSAPREGAASASASVVEQAAAASSLAEPDLDFRPIDDSTPLGEVIIVREPGALQMQAIRSLTVGWYAVGFSHVLPIKPTEWAPLPTVA